MDDDRLSSTDVYGKVLQWFARATLIILFAVTFAARYSAINKDPAWSKLELYIARSMNLKVEYLCDVQIYIKGLYEVPVPASDPAPDPSAYTVQLLQP